MGKITERNKNANKMLKKLYLEKGINYCEVGFPGCLVSSFLTFAHRHKRVAYLSCPEKLYAFDETVLACVSCHEKMEVSRELTEKVFSKLRGS